MAKRPALETARDTIVSFFDAHRPRAYRLGDLRALIYEHKESWGIPASTRATQVITFLEGEGSLREVRLNPEVGEYRAISRYVWGACTPLEIASSLRETGYLTHGTAVFLHGLTEQVPRTIYVNYEQTPKASPTGPLTQQAIDRAFRVEQRTSRYTFHLEGSRYTLLSGKNTGRYGVTSIKGPSGELLQVTGLERTLVDIVVRPAYAGGLHQVLEAYKAAREKEVSVSSILATLRKLNYRYPYHQSIGYLMERAGFDPKHLKRLRELGMEFDFYLGYAMDAPAFDQSWRIFHPQAL